MKLVAAPRGCDYYDAIALGEKLATDPRYMLEGEDSAGEKCHIFIENNGWFETQSMPFKTVPTFITDSKTLAPYLHTNKFRGEGHGEQGGIVIKFFEVENA